MTFDSTADRSIDRSATPTNRTLVDPFPCANRHPRVRVAQIREHLPSHLTSANCTSVPPIFIHVLYTHINNKNCTFFLNVPPSFAAKTLSRQPPEK
jgi:hypothetical protein